VKWDTMLKDGKSVVPGLPWFTLESLEANMKEYKAFFPKRMSQVWSFSLFLFVSRFRDWLASLTVYLHPTIFIS
jgi:hypothetical protein